MPKVYIQGSGGKIDGMYTPSENEKAPSVLILHPHPLYGGTMNNKIIYGMAKQFADSGFSVLRINFRGVGNSDGQFSNGVGELDDAASAFDWLHLQNQKSSQLWVAGFSFGAWIAMQLVMRRPEIDSFVVASTPVSRYNFNFFVPCPIAGLIIQAEEDEISLPQSTLGLHSKLQQNGNIRIVLEVVESATHFFVGHEEQIFDSITSYIKEALTSKNPNKIVRYRKRKRLKKSVA